MRFAQTVTTSVLILAGVAAPAPASHADTDPYPPSSTNVLDGYQIVTVSNADVPNFTPRTASCPRGKRAVGGGGEAHGDNAILLGSFPTDDGTGWTVLGRQYGNDTVGINVYAICANVR